MSLNLIHADWPLTEKVTAFTTLRSGGVSQTPYDDFNLAIHVDDQSEHVKENRYRLQNAIPSHMQIKWLKQTHSNIVVQAEHITADLVEADAAYTLENNIACAVLTADCLPILLTDRNAKCVAAVHAGWRGVINGVIQNTIDAMSEHSQPELAWLGPAISASAFEVGNDVYDEYLSCNEALKHCFTQCDTSKWLLDIYLAARWVLNDAGLSQVYGGNHCTYHEKSKFFSFRRQSQTGRMATIIYKR